MHCSSFVLRLLLLFISAVRTSLSPRHTHTQESIDKRFPPVTPEGPPAPRQLFRIVARVMCLLCLCAMCIYLSLCFKNLWSFPRSNLFTLSLTPTTHISNQVTEPSLAPPPHTHTAQVSSLLEMRGPIPPRALSVRKPPPFLSPSSSRSVL